MFNQLPIELLAEILGYLILLDPNDTYTIAKVLCQISGFKEAICLKLKVLTLPIVVESSKQTYETYFLPKIAPKFRFLDSQHTKLETIYIPDSDATRVNNDLRTMKETPSCSLQTNNLKPRILAATHKLFINNQGEPYTNPDRHDFLLLLELHDYETKYKDSVILSRLPQFMLQRVCMGDVDPWAGSVSKEWQEVDPVACTHIDIVKPMHHGDCGMTAMICPKTYQLASSAHSWNSFELGMGQQIDDLEVEAKAKALALMQILPHNNNNIHIPVSSELTINTNKDILASIMCECTCCFTHQDQTALLQAIDIRFLDRQSQEFSTCYQNVSRYNKKLTRLMIGVGTMGYITPWIVDYLWLKRAELHNYEISDLCGENRVNWQFGERRFQSWPYLQFFEDYKAEKVGRLHRSRNGLSIDVVFFRTKQAATKPTQAAATEKAKYNQQLTQLSLKVRTHSFLKHFDSSSPPSATSSSNPYMTSLFHNSYWRKTESNNLDHDEKATKLKMDQIKEKEDFLDVYHQFLTLIIKGPGSETDTGNSASSSSSMKDINDMLNEISLTDQSDWPDWTKVDLIRFKKYERTCGWLRESVFWELFPTPPII